MRLEDVKPGDAVLITAKDEYFAFVDGWRGTVTGLNNGLVVVECARVDGLKTLFVPADELALSV
jgi:hypothetical protein